MRWDPSGESGGAALEGLNCDPAGPFDSESAAVNHGMKMTAFKRLLLQKCQGEFENADR